MNSRNNILYTILETIDYTDDKEAFVKKFTEVVNIQAGEGLISSLPQEQQESLKNELTVNKDNSEKASEILKAHFNEEQIQKSLEETTKNAVMEWMQAVNPTLSDEQKQKLVALSQEFNPNPPSSATV